MSEYELVTAPNRDIYIRRQKDGGLLTRRAGGPQGMTPDCARHIVILIECGLVRPAEWVIPDKQTASELWKLPGRYQP